MIRTILADDEVLARQKVRQLLKQIEDVDIVGECATAGETIDLVKLTHPDLLFLDVCMPDMDGFDAVSAIFSNQGSKLPQIIFVTANDKWAVRAFEYHALDYLLKPFTAERLQGAVQRARESLASNQNEVASSTLSSGSERFTTRMVFKSRGRILFLAVDEIRWIEAEENYVRLYASDQSHLLRESIGKLEGRLDPQAFLRVHRSAIVNLRYVKEVTNDADGDANVLLMSGEKIPMSRSYRSRIQKLMKFS